MTNGHDLGRELDRFDPRRLAQLAVEATLLFDESHESRSAGGGVTQGESEVQAVRHAIIDLVDRSDCWPSEIINALSALRERDLIPLLRRCLIFQMAIQKAGGMYAAMMALDELGETVFDPQAGRSILDWELNRNLANMYLQRDAETGR